RYPDLLGLRPRRHPYGNPPRRHSHTFRLLRLRLRMQGHTHRVPLCGSLCIAMTCIEDKCERSGLSFIGALLHRRQIFD
ncbi:hypothetical protein IJ732_06025, partial [bacterium]|nr:hypothetical protein [bacterium]